jgi:hypothetical protein
MKCENCYKNYKPTGYCREFKWKINDKGFKLKGCNIDGKLP